MKKMIILVFASLLLTRFVYGGEPKKFYEMSHHQIDSLLTVTTQKPLTITERMEYYSQFFLGTPYDFTCVGDGPYALFEQYPLVNFQETNCMSFCEHVLALSISDSWDNFFNNLQQIRYKDGIIGIRTRNHYTMADWLPENNWLLNDVTHRVGGSYTEKTTRTISHRKFLEKKGIDDLRYVKPDREITIDIVPSKALKDIKGNLKNGDIGALIFANETDIFSAHMFMLIEKEKQFLIRESSTSKMSTFDTPYTEWVEKIENSNRYIGISLMRVKKKRNKPGHIILPWKIKNIRSEL